jgi:hypothetical protein
LDDHSTARRRSSLEVVLGSLEAGEFDGTRLHYMRSLPRVDHPKTSSSGEMSYLAAKSRMMIKSINQETKA